jgi:IS30 family transposase
MIAQEIGVHPSKIIIELNRNISMRGRTSKEYIASNAQRRTYKHHQFKPKLVKFIRTINEQESHWLVNEKWNSEFINVMGHQTGKYPVNAEWLYK